MSYSFWGSTWTTNIVIKISISKDKNRHISINLAALMDPRNGSSYSPHVSGLQPVSGASGSL